MTRRKAKTAAPSATADADEVRRFAARAEAWWDPTGAFRPLHKINPPRLAFVRDHVAARLGRDPLGEKPLRGVRLLDIGCGGGLLAEPMARLGARVTGIDAAAQNIRVAALHAKESGLAIDYRCAVPEDFATEAEPFDVVLNMEVVEHVADVGAFFAACSSLVKPKGAMVVSTINRTLKALALAKIGAEYILRWLPAGTHDWRKFVRPSELAAALRANGLAVTHLKGMIYNPFRDEWVLGGDVDVNYLAFAVKE